MSIFKIRLADTGFLPEGMEISADIDSRDLEKELAALKRTITFLHDEADINRVASPGERSLNNRLDSLQRLIIDGLSPETKLGIANGAVAKPV